MSSKQDVIYWILGITAIIFSILSGSYVYPSIVGLETPNIEYGLLGGIISALIVWVYNFWRKLS